MAGFNPWGGMGAKPIRYDTFENTPYAPRTGVPPQQGAPLVPLQMPQFASLPSYGPTPLDYPVGPTPGELTQTAVNQEALQNTAPGSGGQAAMALSGAGTPVRQNAADPDMKRYIDFLNQLDTKGKEVVATQQAGVDQYGRSLEATKALPGQLDLSPLLALSDTWYGGNLSKGYTKPASTEQRTQDIMALQNALSRQKAGVSETELGLIKQRLGGEEALAGMKNAREMAALRKQEMAQAKQTRAEDRQDAADRADAELYMKSDVGTKQRAAIRGMDYVNRVKSLIAKNGGVIPTHGAAKAEFAQAFKDLQIDQKEQAGLGALSGPDMGLIEGALGSDELWKNAVAKFMEGGTQGTLLRLDGTSRSLKAKWDANSALAEKRYKLPTAVELIKENKSQWGKVSGQGESTGYPLTVTKGGKSTTVENEAELREAQADGWITR